ncbi:MAG: hypothetical protein WBF68_02165 [Atribacterota bacterium]
MNNNFNLSSLSTNQIKELWSKTYNRDGKPDWSHIFPYYHEEIGTCQGDGSLDNIINIRIDYFGRDNNDI